MNKMVQIINTEYLFNAIKWTGDNYEEIKEFCEQYHSDIQKVFLIRPGEYERKEWLLLTTGSDLEFVDIGDYIYLNKYNYCEVLEKEEFEHDYIEIGGNKNG